MTLGNSASCGEKSSFERKSYWLTDYSVITKNPAIVQKEPIIHRDPAEKYNIVLNNSNKIMKLPPVWAEDATRLDGSCLEKAIILQEPAENYVLCLNNNSDYDEPAEKQIGPKIVLTGGGDYGNDVSRGEKTANEIVNHEVKSL